jgi:hypothetical protein
MDQYRNHFLNTASRLIGTASFPAPNVVAALSETRRVLLEHDYRAAAELWRHDRYIGSVLRSDALINEPVSAERRAKCSLLQKAS